MCRGRRGTTIALAVLMCVLAVACGSTSKTAKQVGDASSDRAGSTDGATGASPAAGSSTGAAGGPGSIGGSGAGRTGRAPGSSGARAGTASVTSPGKVVGVTAKEIRIGFGTQKDADQASKTFGLSAVFGDQEAQARAIANDINARGGVLGRKLVLVFHDERSASDIANPDATGARQCADWTQDRPVFAGMNIVGGRNRTSFFGCMAKAKTPLLVSDLAPHSIHQINTYAPYLYAPGVATADRWAPVWIERLEARKYFTPWNTTTGSPGTAPVKIGVPYTDNDDGRRYLDDIKAALAKVHRSVAESFAFPENDGDALRAIPQMLLRFQSQNVTHVLLPSSAYLVTPASEQQGYRPRWAMTTLDGLSSLTVTTSPKAQLRGVLGIGWLPVSDTDASHDPGPVSPNQTRCKAAMERQGLSTADRLTFTTQLIVCELFLFFAAALEQAGAITPAALQEGAKALASRFPSAMTFAERFGPNRYDGADAVRDIAYDTACSCFKYLDRRDHRFG
jgi:ABC-type branched-subunit amino acid transport system substrate-binding protein